MGRCRSFFLSSVCVLAGVLLGAVGHADGRRSAEKTGVASKTSWHHSLNSTDRSIFESALISRRYLGGVLTVVDDAVSRVTEQAGFYPQASRTVLILGVRVYRGRLNDDHTRSIFRSTRDAVAQSKTEPIAK
jgi:hypothetical protein